MKQCIFLKNRKILTSFFATCLLFFARKAEAQAGTLDISFGKGGKVISDFRSSSSVAIDSSGKIWVAPDSLLIRYLSNGNLDSTFGINGIQTTVLHGNNKVLIQPDRKIIIAGTFSDSAGFTSFEVARYHLDGNIDSAFGRNGKQVTNFAYNSYCENASLQPDGKILLIGYTQSGSEAAAPLLFAIARFQVNGNPDSTFGTNGKQTISFKERSDRGYGITVQNDGKIVAAGDAEIPINDFSGLQEFGLVRLQTNGQPDSSFGVNGKQISMLGDAGSSGRSVMIQHDNKIVVAGNSFTAGVKVHSDFALVRYKTNGTVDSTFGINGEQIINFGSNTIVGEAVLQPDDKIIVAGYSTDFLNTTADFALARYSANGMLDSTFGINGIEITKFDKDSQASSLALQHDGKIIVCGQTSSDIGSGIIALARYNNDLSLPVTFTSLTGKRTGNTVMLNWQTATELNNKYFSVERSSNGISFKEIGRVNSKGNISSSKEYVFSDPAPLSNSNYYRLRHVDADGHFAYSKTVLVNFEIATNIKLYPNPVRDILIAEGLNRYTKSTLIIIDASGRVMQTAVTTNDRYLWNVKMLPAGEYYLCINSINKNITFKFIKE